MGNTPQSHSSSPLSTAEAEACPLAQQNCTVHQTLSKLHQRIDDLERQVNTDALTGLYNRKHLNESIDQEIERTVRSRQPTSLILLDLDHFKAVNDTYGHTAGDDVLRAVAKALLNSVRKLDIACRYGGEEFAVILPGTYQLVATQVAERIRQAIASSVITHGDFSIPITASIGVDTFTSLTKENTEQFIERVDQLLYDAKNQGRNRVVTRTAPSDKDPSHVSSAERNALFDD